jgi:hypothetical protein
MDNSSIRDQYNRTYVIQNSFSGELRDIVDKEKEVKDSVSIEQDSDEKESGENASENIGRDAKSSKVKPGTEKRKDSGSILNPDTPHDSDNSGDTSVDEKDLSVLFYSHSAGDLLCEKPGEGLIDIEGFGGTDDINIVARYIGPKETHGMEDLIIDGGWEDTRRYYITRDDDPEFEPITQEVLLDLSEKLPDNPYLYEAIAKKYRDIGDETKTLEYLNKVSEIKIQTESRNEIQKKLDEYLAVIEEEFFDKYIFNDCFNSFDNAIEHNVKSIFPEEPAFFQDFVEWRMENFPVEDYAPMIDTQSFPNTENAHISP